MLVPNQKRYLIVSSLIAATGGLIFGYDVGIISGAMFQLQDRFNLSPVQEGLIVSLLSVGSLCGCLVGGYLADKLGRWKTIHIQNIIFTCGFLTLAFSMSVPALYCGRLILGCASAFSAVAGVPYLLEISPVEFRGRVSAMYEVMIVLGALLATLSSLCLFEVSYGWRVMFLLPTIFAVCQSCGLFFLPESPKWLFEIGRIEEAKKSLMDINCGDVVAADMAFASLQSAARDSPTQAALHYDELFALYRVSVAAVVILMALGQFTGSVVVRNFAPTIFNSAGIGHLKSLLLNTIISIINLVVVLVAVRVVDRVGRLFILKLGLVTSAVGMLILTVGFQVSSRSIDVFLVGGTLTSAGFNMGFGPVGWILASELFPTKIRGRALSISILFRNCFEFATNFLFLSSVGSLGASPTFAIFFVFCIVSLLYTFFALTESKELEPDVILHRLEMMWFWRIVKRFSAYCGLRLGGGGYGAGSSSSDVNARLISMTGSSSSAYAHSDYPTQSSSSSSTSSSASTSTSSSPTSPASPVFFSPSTSSPMQ